MPMYNLIFVTKSWAGNSIEKFPDKFVNLDYGCAGLIPVAAWLRP
jgi:hypothetical protein